MAGVFISYRRDDAQGEARHLFDDLKRHFGADRIFMDVTTIRPGEDFRKVIDSAVASCDVLVALIGKEWARSVDTAGKRRLDNGKDFVRFETAAALKRDVRVIPVLVQGASMPEADELPEDLKPLAYRNALELSHSRWDFDMRVLIETLERLVAPSSVASDQPAPAGPGTRQPASGGDTSASTTSGVLTKGRMAVVGALLVALLGGGYWLTSELTTPAGPTKPTPSQSTWAQRTSPEGTQVASSPPPPSTPSAPAASVTAPATSAAPARAAATGVTGTREGDPSVPSGPQATSAEPSPPSTPSAPTPPVAAPAPSGRPARVAVPGVTGMREADAHAALERVGLVVGSRSRTKRRDVEPGTVLRQMPGPGESVEKGRAVALDVAIADLRTVPNVVGRSVRDAATVLQQDEFKTETTREPTDGATPGSVLRQEPRANAQVAPGSTITLTVAVAATIEVPNVIRMRRSDALAVLSGKGFVPRVAEQPTGSAPPETVIDQSPVAGARVQPRSPIEVKVAVLPEPVAVPRVTGLSRREAIDILRNLGLQYRIAVVPTRTPSPDVVVGQDPDAGARLRPGSVVALNVGAPREPGTCIQGYVWREAFPGDRVCVTPDIRAQAAHDNQAARSRIEPDPRKRPYGPDTCAQGFVWREAGPSDHVCVAPETRARARDDNRQSQARIAR